MTKALEFILTELQVRKTTEFRVPLSLLVEGDRVLLERGILKFNGAFKTTTICPECASWVEVKQHGDPMQAAYTCLCAKCECWEEQEIDPSEVELLDFNYRQFMLYVNDQSVTDDYANEAAKCISMEGGGMSYQTSRGPSKTIAVLKRLQTVVKDACAHSKDGDFLFKREEYVSAVNELWTNQTNAEYAISREESSEVAGLWMSVRQALVLYAQSMINGSAKLTRDLSNERCYLLFPKFERINEEPHVLDVGTLKELYATLKTKEVPRRVIVTPKPSKVRGNKPGGEIVDIDALPQRHYRFAMSRDFTTVVDLRHTKPSLVSGRDASACEGYEIYPYLKLKKSAAAVIKKLILEAGKKGTQGWCKSEPKWRGLFQSSPYSDFKRDQIEVARRSDGLFYWRIVPDESFHAHYCKEHPKDNNF